MFKNTTFSYCAVLFKHITLAKIKVYIFVSIRFNLRALEFWKPSVNTAIHITRPTSTNMRREEKPTRCHWMVYCTYNMLNMFRALLCPSSWARDYMCVITAYGVRCLGCWLLEVRCRAAGYAFGMRDVARATSLMASSWENKCLPCCWKIWWNNLNIWNFVYKMTRFKILFLN